MAHFYGVIKGQRGEASRLGSKNSGLQTTAASWQGAVRTTLYVKDGTDCALVELMPWRGEGTHQKLYDGPVAGQSDWDNVETFTCCHAPVELDHFEGCPNHPDRR